MQRVVVSVRLSGESAGTDFEVPTDTAAAELARQFAQTLTLSAGGTRLELRSPSLARALRPDETFAEAGLWDGATLVLARATDPLETVTALAVPHAHARLAVLPIPTPPLLAVPPEAAQPRPRLPTIVLGVVLLALVGTAAWFLRPHDSSPTAAEPIAPAAIVQPTQAQPATLYAPAPPTPAPAPTQPPAPATTDEESAWRALLTQLDSVWGVDWPASIGLLQAFHAQYPTRASATEKLYAALVEYGLALRDAGATGAAMDELEQAVRLAPQRFEARDELARLQLSPTEVPPPTVAPPVPAAAAPVVRQPAPAPVAAPAPLPTREPAPTLAPSRPVLDTTPDQTSPACDVRNPDIACPLADGARVQDALGQPDGRHFYWFGVPAPGLRLHVEIDGPACPCTLLVFSDVVDNGSTAIAAATASESNATTPAAATVLERLMPDPGPYLLELVPDQSNATAEDVAYTLAFSLQLPAPPTPVPAVEEPTPAPTATPVPVAVPPVVARPASEAANRLRALGLVARLSTADRYSPAGPATIATQDPPAGVRLPPGSAVTLVVASGNVVIPAVVGLTESEATAALHESGFEVDTRRARRSNTDAGRAADVNPGPGNALPAGSTVILTISQGP